ncbi:MAG: amidohydrolase [Candidatus ainarchaeum sp.]|nr:amidohydrolase [Candidatus ainarchaeum sp.]
MDILIRNATLITQNAKREILKSADIFVSNGKIGKVGKNLKENAEEKIDAKGKIIFPGLVNAHTHIAMTLFRGYGEGMRLQDWLTKRIWPAEARLKPEHAYRGAMLGIAEMVRSGTTAFNEMYVAGMEKIAEAAETGGVRATLAFSMIDDVPGHETEKELREGIGFAGKLKSRSGRVKAGIACHAPYTCTGELIQKGKEAANRMSIPFHIHASETRKEVFDVLKKRGQRPVEYLDKLGVLDRRTVLAHAVYVTKREIGIAGKKGASVAHCPVSNLKLAGGGVCPIGEFARSGANAALGTDGAASNNSLNMLETMKMAALLQKNFYWDPLALSAQQALDFATINGAKALGINAGSIEEGKLADLVIADANAPNMNPRHSDMDNIVYAMNPSNITDVIIDGKFAMRNRKMSFDEKKVVEKACEAALDLVGE